MRGKPKIREQKVTANMEDYLEVIYELEQEKGRGEARVSDIARRLEVTRPSVVGMIKHLQEHGLVNHGSYKGVSLTERGREIAGEMWERHQVLRRFLEEVLGLDAEVAEEDACRMEHALSPVTIERFIALEEFREKTDRITGRPGDSFRDFLRKRKKEPESRKKREKRRPG